MSHAVTVRPIKTEEDFDAALKRIAALMPAAQGSAESDELDVLLTLAQAYEHEHYPVGPADPVEAVKFAMDRLELTETDLAKYFGSKEAVSEFLAGSQTLEVQTIRRLHEGLGIGLDSLVA